MGLMVGLTTVPIGSVRKVWLAGSVGPCARRALWYKTACLIRVTLWSLPLARLLGEMLFLRQVPLKYATKGLVLCWRLLRSKGVKRWTDANF